jgi:hypothetical protein
LPRDSPSYQCDLWLKGLPPVGPHCLIHPTDLSSVGRPLTVCRDVDRNPVHLIPVVPAVLHMIAAIIVPAFVVFVVCRGFKWPR